MQHTNTPGLKAPWQFWCLVHSPAQRRLRLAAAVMSAAKRGRALRAAPCMLATYGTAEEYTPVL
jgi:hypothetical protein